ncbi:MAG TPA: putative quinol monooxygenase [Longilinea sp.]|nr:putative quinol monooxygenase [Longilinea sp.]
MTLIERWLIGKGNIMHSVFVHVHVKADYVEAFRSATMENASHSVLEPGIARFDVFQLAEDSTRFILIEIYRDEEAPARHKETEHYKKWRDGVADMMAEPRQGIRYVNVYPDKL